MNRRDFIKGAFTNLGALAVACLSLRRACELDGLSREVQSTWPAEAWQLVLL